MSLDTLIEKIIEKQNPTVAGLDPSFSSGRILCEIWQNIGGRSRCRAAL